MLKKCLKTFIDGAGSGKAVSNSELVFTGNNANSQGSTYVGFTELFEASSSTALTPRQAEEG